MIEIGGCLVNLASCKPAVVLPLKFSYSSNDTPVVRCLSSILPSVSINDCKSLFEESSKASVSFVFCLTMAATFLIKATYALEFSDRR